MIRVLEFFCTDEAPDCRLSFLCNKTFNNTSITVSSFPLQQKETRINEKFTFFFSSFYHSVPRLKLCMTHENLWTIKNILPWILYIFRVIDIFFHKYFIAGSANLRRGGRWWGRGRVGSVNHPRQRAESGRRWRGIQSSANHHAGKVARF